MIVVTTALRTTRGPRRSSYAASLLRVLGSVQVSESPPEQGAGRYARALEV